MIAISPAAKATASGASITTISWRRRVVAWGFPWCALYDHTPRCVDSWLEAAAVKRALAWGCASPAARLRATRGAATLPREALGGARIGGLGREASASVPGSGRASGLKPGEGSLRRLRLIRSLGVVV